MHTKEKIFYFFEESKTTYATSFRIFIILLILISSGSAVISLFTPTYLEPYHEVIIKAEFFVLVIFTLEYVLRFATSPNKVKFAIDKFNLIDLLAIVPFYLGFNNLAYLRAFRILRLLRLLKYIKIYGVFQFRETIFEKITPLVLLLVLFKSVIIYLEKIGTWFAIDNVSVLFTIIGFALGVILSQKIGTTYGKYLDLERAMFSMHGKVSSLVFNLNALKNKAGTKAMHSWIEDFLKIYRGPDKDCVKLMVKSNERLYNKVLELGNHPLIPHHRLAALLSGIFEDSTFIIGRKSSYTPSAYDKLLQQVLLLYLALIAIFLPGANGMISVAIATYLLYGMYYVTQDFDLAVGDKKISLIKLDPSRLQYFFDELDKDLKI